MMTALSSLYSLNKIGHLEFGEEWNQCVEREVMEETGLSVSHIKLFAVTNDIMITTDNKHYITIFMTCETTDPDQEPENRESHKNEFWKWINWSDLRSDSYNDRLFLPLQHLVFREDQPDPFVEQQNLLN